MKAFKPVRLPQLLAALLLLLVLSVPLIAQAQNVDTVKIFNDFAKVSSPDEAIKYFTDDATLALDKGGEVYRGKDAILNWAKQNGAFSPNPNMKVVHPAQVQGNKVTLRVKDLPAPLAQIGVTFEIESDLVAEFLGDKIKSLTIDPTPESLQKLEAFVTQGGSPGVPGTGQGGTNPATPSYPVTLWLLIGGGVILLISAFVLVRRQKVR